METLHDQGKYEEAIPLAKQALEITEASVTPNHPDLIQPLRGLGNVYYAVGRYAEAEDLAKEAIEIGEAFGDEALRALNLVNLGNIYLDQDRAKEAILTYAEAGISAQKCGRRDIEADASRLQAGALNDLPSAAVDFPDRHERAQAFAEHAVGLLENSLYYAARGNAFIELGDAKEALRAMAESW